MSSNKTVPSVEQQSEKQKRRTRSDAGKVRATEDPMAAAKKKASKLRTEVAELSRKQSELTRLDAAIAAFEAAP